MDYNLIVSAKAELQIRNALSYLKDVLFNESAKEKLRQLINETIRRIMQNPYEFPLCLNKNFEVRGYREAS